MISRKLFLIAWLASQAIALHASTVEDVRLTLPPTGYAVVGSEMNVFFENLVLTEKSADLRFEVTSDLGTSDGSHWTVMPKDADVGIHDWQVTVKRGGQAVARGNMRWIVSPKKAQRDREIALLIIGDSLTHATIYPNALARLLSESGVHWKMLGTHRPPGALSGVAHEGYGGWTWQRFLTHFEPNPDPDKTKRKHSSPFVFQVDEKPRFDLGRFIHESCANQPPDFVIFNLGINDCFGANPNELAKTDEHIDGVFKQAEILIKAFRDAAPRAELGICLTTPGNARDAAFIANYKDRYSRWGWKRIQHRLVERQLKQFGGRESDRVYLIPTELNLDIVRGYPSNNAVHPNQLGYEQVAATIYAWLMSRLASAP